MFLPTPLTPRSGAAVLAVAVAAFAFAPVVRAAPSALATEQRARPPVPAVRVASSGQLARALAATTPRTIILANGVYDHPRPFVNGYGHRVLAAHPGRAVVKTGFVLGGNWGNGGGVLRGVTIDIGSADRTLDGAAVTVWGSGRNSTIVDTRVLGRGVASAGVFVLQPDGVTIRRVTVSAVTSFGIAVLPRNPSRSAVPKPTVLEDVRVSDVARPVPRSSNGTAEACIWAATRVVVRRASLRRCAWSGLWAGEAVGSSLFDQVSVADAPVGVYAEHFTEGARFRRMTIGPNVTTGVNCEWADPAWGGRAACHGVVIEDSRIETSKVGVFLDVGTTRTAVRRVRFVGQRWAGIGDHRGVENTFSRNVFRRLAPGARAISRNHVNGDP